MIGNNMKQIQFLLNRFLDQIIRLHRSFPKVLILSSVVLSILYRITVYSISVPKMKQKMQVSIHQDSPICQSEVACYKLANLLIHWKGKKRHFTHNFHLQKNIYSLSERSKANLFLRPWFLLRRQLSHYVAHKILFNVFRCWRFFVP